MGALYLLSYGGVMSKRVSDRIPVGTGHRRAL